MLTTSKASGKVIDLAETWNQTGLTLCPTAPQHGLLDSPVLLSRVSLRDTTWWWLIITLWKSSWVSRFFSEAPQFLRTPCGLASVDTVARSQAKNELLTDRTFLKVETMFVQSISAQRLQEAHDLWCRAAHDYCREAVAKAPLPLAKACRRGVVPRFVQQPFAAKVLSVTHGAVTSREQTLAKLGQANPSSPVSCRQRTLLERPSPSFDFVDMIADRFFAKPWKEQGMLDRSSARP